MKKVMTLTSKALGVMIMCEQRDAEWAGRGAESSLNGDKCDTEMRAVRWAISQKHCEASRCCSRIRVDV